MNAPTEYNELVELVEKNDPGVVASVIQDTHTPNNELRELMDELEECANGECGTWHHPDYRFGVERAIVDLRELVEA